MKSNHHHQALNVKVQFYINFVELVRFWRPTWDSYLLSLSYSTIDVRFEAFRYLPIYLLILERGSQSIKIIIGDLNHI